MITMILSTQAERAYALLRIVTGLLFTVHGAQKLFGFLDGKMPPAGSLLWIGGVLELVLGLAIALGFFTSWAAFISSGMMAVAYIKYHWQFQFDSAFFPVVNKGELAVVYAFLFLFMACKGSGMWSIDRCMAMAKAKKSS